MIRIEEWKCPICLKWHKGFKNVVCPKCLDDADLGRMVRAMKPNQALILDGDPYRDDLPWYATEVDEHGVIINAMRNPDKFSRGATPEESLRGVGK